MNKRLITIGIAVTIAYTIIVSLWIGFANQAIDADMAQTMANAPEGLEGDDLTNWFLEQERATDWPFLLKVLVFPIGTVARAITGTIPFLAMLAQGALIGALAASFVNHKGGQAELK